MKYDENGVLIPQKVNYKITPEEETKEIIECVNGERYLKRIIFFDIDGCICESFFPNLNEKANIKELREKVLETPLNRDFIQVYKRITNNTGLKIPKLSFKHVKNHKRFWVRKLNELKTKQSKFDNNQIIEV